VNRQLPRSARKHRKPGEAAKQYAYAVTRDENVLSVLHNKLGEVGADRQAYIIPTES